MKRTRRVLASALGFGVLVASSCGVFGGPDLVVVGDSITGLTDPVVQERFDRSYDVTTNGRWGARADEQLDAARTLAAGNPEVVIINLGTNDALQRRPTDETIGALLQMIDIFRDVDCIRLTTISESIERLGSERGAEAAAINDALRNMVKPSTPAGQSIALADWNERVERLGVGVLTNDTIHPNERGALELADTYADSLVSCPA